MVKYNIKNMSASSSKVLQGKIKNWVESRKHLNIMSVNIWSDDNMAYSTIIYVEQDYNL